MSLCGEDNRNADYLYCCSYRVLIYKWWIILPYLYSYGAFS